MKRFHSLSIFKKFLGKQVLNSLGFSLPTSRLAGSKAHCSASPGAEAGGTCFLVAVFKHRKDTES